MDINKVRVAAGILVTLWAGVSGHGRLLEPPSRASAWRSGHNTPRDDNDDDLTCGGYDYQWKYNGGKCGVCGDPWDSPEPRPHELGGHYAPGIILRRYAPGDLITVAVENTINLEGFFEFRICMDPKPTQDCLDQNLLIINGKETKYYLLIGNRVYWLSLQLPQDLECEHCLLQWRYTAANLYGVCDNGTEGEGCGPQQQFFACADIAINRSMTTTELSSTLMPNIKPIPATIYGIMCLFFFAIITAIFVFAASMFIPLIPALLRRYQENGASHENTPIPDSKEQILGLNQESFYLLFQSSDSSVLETNPNSIEPSTASVSAAQSTGDVFVPPSDDQN